MRGEFIRADGLVIPNNITTYGIQTLLGAALTDTGYDFYLGLANCNPDPELLIEDLNEPTLGVNGYARQQITRDLTGWPVSDLLNGEPYFETKSFVFAASGGAFDKAINRFVIINSAAAATGQLVVALSTPLPAEIVIDEATDISLRSFKYRIYAR